MKPLLGIDCTLNRKNYSMNIESLDLQSPNQALKESLDATMNEAEATNERAKLPGYLRFLQYITGAGAFVIFAGIVRGLVDSDGLSIGKTYGNNAKGLFWICGGCFLLWAVLRFLAARRAKMVFNQEETVVVESRLKSAETQIYRDLGVPANAPDVDLLMYRYVNKKGKIKPLMIPGANTPYLPASFKVYAQEDKLYFANLEMKLALPLSAMKQIRKIDKKIAVLSWIKDVSPKDEPYAQYKIKEGQGMVYYKPYYELSFMAKGEEWTVMFPCYELPVMEAGTGLHVSAE